VRAATLSHVHVHQAPPAGSTDPRTLLLLHGTGGTEHDLLGLGAQVAPGARLLGVRGQVLENGMPRFFRRLAEGVFDEADVIRRAAALAAFVGEAASAYGFDATQVMALGYSNGANIAAAMLLLHPDVLRGGALLRTMVPLTPASPPELRGRRVLLAQGTLDPVVPRANAEALATQLRTAGAEVDLRFEPVGHSLVAGDVRAVSAWMAGTP
jgi:phospholipase/carboxylesterase